MRKVFKQRDTLHLKQCEKAASQIHWPCKHLPSFEPLAEHKPRPCNVPGPQPVRGNGIFDGLLPQNRSDWDTNVRGSVLGQSLFPDLLVEVSSDHKPLMRRSQHQQCSQAPSTPSIRSPGVVFALRIRTHRCYVTRRISQRAQSMCTSALDTCESSVPGRPGVV